jgi:hypothetical protein
MFAHILCEWNRNENPLALAELNVELGIAIFGEVLGLRQGVERQVSIVERKGFSETFNMATFIDLHKCA